MVLVLGLVLTLKPPYPHTEASKAPVNKNINNQVKVEQKVQPVQAKANETKPIVQEPSPQPAKPTPIAHPIGCENYVTIYEKHFGSKAATFLRIAKAESGCNPRAVGDTHLTYTQNGVLYGMSCGMLQVRFLPGRPTCSEMQNPDANAAYAAMLYASGGFGHWTVCNKGIVNCY